MTDKNTADVFGVRARWWCGESREHLAVFCRTQVQYTMSLTDLFIYEKGGHGFGADNQNYSVMDRWMCEVDQKVIWKINGCIIKGAAQPKAYEQVNCRRYHFCFLKRNPCHFALSRYRVISFIICIRSLYVNDPWHCHRSVATHWITVSYVEAFQCIRACPVFQNHLQLLES